MLSDSSNVAATDSTHMNLPSHVAEALSDQITRGILAQGERLVESKIAEEFNVSHSPVREALRLLQRNGLVVVRPRRGAIVAPVTEKFEVDLRDTLVAFMQACPLFLEEDAEALSPKDISVLGTLQEELDQRAAAEPFSGADFLIAQHLLFMKVVSQPTTKLLPRLSDRLWLQYRHAYGQKVTARQAKAQSKSWKKLITRLKRGQHAGLHISDLSLLGPQTLPEDQDLKDADSRSEALRGLSGVTSPEVPAAPELQLFMA